jgi:hypothetical protein
MLKQLFASALACLCIAQATNAQTIPNTDQSKFRQLWNELPTPNNYRSASGAPGHQYWQQKADYVINVKLDDKNRSVTGDERITYTNNSPDVLRYIWVQLDQNIFEKNADSKLSEPSGFGNEAMSIDNLERMVYSDFKGGYRIDAVNDAAGKKLKYTINKTMMRIDLPTPLRTGGKFTFQIKWFNYINNMNKDGGRGGYEYFEKDDNVLYEMAQWFPRMAVYDDVWGWQHKQYLGRGEFALDFGDYEVNIAVPTDFVIASTGELKNQAECLNSTQLTRWNKAKTSKVPVEIITQQEAEANEKSRATTYRTWKYKAENVRDFAWAASRKFIWDAMLVNVEGKNVWAMSYYPKEGNPLWGQYSTKVVAHTLKSYSKHTIAYPYPVAISVHGPVFGMEYPMISFNGGRPDADGTYSERLKYGMIGVIIHEVGHNFFPMIINSDERQWSWMDEGLNTFCQYLAEQEWDRNYPSSRGEPAKITDYMKSDKKAQVPIMVNSESALQFGNNAYGKPATGLNILRETILGRELFDFAFKTYSQRWAFKHPHPQDFFRTMEDASGVDLDWFWRGWFYTTDHTDISLKSVNSYAFSADPNQVAEFKKLKRAQGEISISDIRNKTDIPQSLIEADPSLLDFYNSYDALNPTEREKKESATMITELTPNQKEILKTNWHAHLLEFENIGGLVMPLIIKMVYEDGSDTIVRLPAEIWKYDNVKTSKVLVTPKKVVEFQLDPLQEIADCDLSNNYIPRKIVPTQLQLYKQRRQARESTNPLRESKVKTANPSGN